MKLEIITAEEAHKLTENKQSGVPPDAVDKALHEIDHTIKLAAYYKGSCEHTFDVSHLFLGNTGVTFSDEDKHKAARKVAQTLR